MDRIAVASIRHPVVIIAAGIALWSVALAPTTQYPLLSITGSPQIAEGALLWLDIAVFIAGIRLLQCSQRHFETLGFGILFAAILLPVLALFPATRGIWFNDHLAFLGIAAAVAVPLALAERFPRTYSRILLAAIAGLPALAVSRNLSAFAILILVSLPVFIITHRALQANGMVKIRTARFAATAIVASLALAIPFAISWLDAFDVIKSMQSRALIIDALYGYIADQPGVILFGYGWGHTEQVFAEALAGTKATIWDRSWDAAWRDIFHSHNQAFEALSSAGLPAAVAVIAFGAALPYYSSERNLPSAAAYAIGYVGVASMWFQMPGSVPFTAAAMAILTGRAMPAPVRKTAPGVLLVALATVAAIQFFVAGFLGTIAWEAHKIDNLLASQTAEDRKTLSCGTFPSEGWRGDSGLSLQLLRSFNIVVTPEKGYVLQSPDIERLRYFACTATMRARQNRSHALLRAGLLFRAQLAYNPNFAPYREEFAGYLEDWEEQVGIFLDIEPARPDLIYPFLAWSLLQDKYSKVLAISDTMLAHDNRDAIALWFKGLALYQRGTPGERAPALRYLQSGLRQGVEKWFRIPDETKRMIRNEAAPKSGK